MLKLYYVSRLFLDESELLVKASLLMASHHLDHALCSELRVAEAVRNLIHSQTMLSLTIIVHNQSEHKCPH